VKELAMGGVAEVVVGVSVGLVEGEGSDDDGEGFQGFRSVAEAAFAGDDALDVGFERERDGEDELAVARGNREGMAEGDGFVVGRESDGTGDGDGGNLGVVGDEELGVGGARARDWNAGGATAVGGAGIGCGVGGVGSGGEGELLVVPEGPEADAEGGMRCGSGLGSGVWGLGNGVGRVGSLRAGGRRQGEEQSEGGDGEP
jgi:hypothetical protein